MTRAQRTELDRAVEKACKAGLEVMGTGHRKSDGAKIFAVPSQSQPNRFHIVTLVGNRLICDCRSRVICCHRGAVHMEMVVQADRRRRLAEEVEAALREERDEAARREAERASFADDDRWALIEAGQW